MKKKLFFLSLFIFFAIAVSAQLNKIAPVSADNLRMELPGKLFTQFVQSVNSTSLTNSFAKEKKALLKDIVKVKDPSLMAKKITSFAGYIKPAMFKTNFNMQEFSNRAAGAKTMIYSMNMLSDLEESLKPEALSGVWKFQKNDWITQMTKLD